LAQVRPDARTFRRRRLVALAVLGSVVAAIALLVGSGQPPERAAHKPAAAHPKRRAPVPVLMYHGVEPPVPGGLPYLFVRPAAFRAQMEALAEAGGHGVTMAQVEAAWQRGMPLPPKPVVITFDDGYRGQANNALPVLQRHGWPGVLYMCIANFRSPSGLREDDVRKLLRADWELGAHTFSHLDLRTLNAAELRHEVGESRRWLERRFGVPVTSFAYPAGKYGPAALKELRRARFQSAVTVAPGLARPGRPLELNRIRVSSTTTASGLMKELKQLGWR